MFFPLWQKYKATIKWFKISLYIESGSVSRNLSIRDSDQQMIKTQKLQNNWTEMFCLNSQWILYLENIMF